MKKSLLFLLCAWCMGTGQVSAQEEVLKTRILYIRHGEVPGNDPNPATYLYTGCQTDFFLTEKGKGQAEKCAAAIGDLGQIAAIYASDLKRAIETAQPIASKLGLTIQVRHDLREIDWGDADGQLVQKMTEKYEKLDREVKQRYPDRKVRWDHVPVFEGAETYNALLQRTLIELKAIADSHQGETVIVVGHGRVLKTLIANALDAEDKIPYPANCGIAEFIFSPVEGLRFVKVLK